MSDDGLENKTYAYSLHYVSTIPLANACIKIRLIDVDLFPWLAAPQLDYVIMS